MHKKFDLLLGNVAQDLIPPGNIQEKTEDQFLVQLPKNMISNKKKSSSHFRQRMAAKGSENGIYSCFMTVLFVVIVGIGNASADMVTSSTRFTGSSTNPSSGLLVPLHDSGMEIMHFNPSTEMLNSVILDLSLDCIHGKQFDVSSTLSGSTFTKTMDQVLAIGSLLNTGVVRFSKTKRAEVCDRSTNYAWTPGFTSTDTGGARNVQLAFTGAHLKPFISTGSLPFDVCSSASSVINITGGNRTVINTYNCDVNATATYNCTPTPIPAAVWLFGSGLAALAVIIKKIFGID